MFPRLAHLSVPLLIAGLLACGGGGTDPAQPPPTIAAFTATPASVSPGGASQLLATFSNGTGLITPGAHPVLSLQPLTVHPAADTTYTLTVTGSSGATATQSVTVRITAPAEPWTPTQLPDPVAARVKADLDHLADPALEGRLTGAPGCIQAASFIAQRMQEIGLGTINGPGMGGETPFHYTYLVPGRTFTSSNLVGVIPGSDPVLKDEYVIVSAHYDHIGRTSQGVVVPGANDNASGTAGILEAARLLIASSPHRSILFLAVSGEELGLYGSKAFVNSPPVPLEQIVADINLDMIGRGAPGAYHVTPAALPNKVTTLVRDARRAADFHGIPLSAGIDPYYAYSDQYSFGVKGIPTIFFHDGEDTDYHIPTDTADKIDYVKLVGFLKLTRDLAYVTANASGRPALVPASEYLGWTWGQPTMRQLRPWEGWLSLDAPLRIFRPADLLAPATGPSAPPAGR